MKNDRSLMNLTGVSLGSSLIPMRYDNFNCQSRGFEISLDIGIRHYIRYCNVSTFFRLWCSTLYTGPVFYLDTVLTMGTEWAIERGSSYLDGNDNNDNNNNDNDDDDNDNDNNNDNNNNDNDNDNDNDNNDNNNNNDDNFCCHDNFIKGCICENNQSSISQEQGVSMRVVFPKKFDVYLFSFRINDNSKLRYFVTWF